MSLKNSPTSKRWGYFILVALFLNLISYVPAKAAYQSSGLIADWIGSTLTNNTSQWNDSINNNKLDQSSTTYSSSNGGYVSLDGTTSSFLRSPSDLTSFSTSNFSMFFWIKPTANSGIIMQIGRNGTDADSEAVFGINGSSNLYFWDWNGTQGIGGASSSTLTLNSWSYVGFTKSTTSGTSTLTYYINGSAAGSSTAADKSLSLNDFVIGKDYRDNTLRFNGSIARASVWSSTLSSSDVQNNYLATNGIAIAPSISTSNNSQSVNAGSAITTATTTNSGGAVSTYAISPTLPTGLNMDGSGNISGTPTAVQSSTNYTITATNSAGTSTSTFTLTVLINSTTATFTNLSLAYYRQPTTLTITVNVAGKVTFKHQGKNIVGCIKVATVTSSTITATCSWKPSVKKYVSLTAVFVPTSAAYATSNAAALRPLVIARSGTR